MMKIKRLKIGMNVISEFNKKQGLAGKFRNFLINTI